MAVSSSLVCLLLISLTISAISSAKPVNNGGFSVELIHRDSPNSPLHRPSETHYQRVANAVRRSVSRTHRFSAESAEAPIYYNRGEYVMKMSLGTPPFPISAIPDTGSDIIWTQCAPCSECYPQTDPLFNPTKSSTYRNLPCSSPKCAAPGLTSCSRQSDCQYSISYGDRSHSNGDVAADTVTLGSTAGRPVAFPKTVIGCGHDNGGTFDANVSGIIGLGRGPMSLVSQMEGINGKFSYCLTPLSSKSADSSKIIFGGGGAVSGAGTVSTPIREGDVETFYWLTLEAISVGEHRIEFDQAPSNTNGNIIIDSGTTLTILPQDFFSNFAAAVADQVKLERASDPNKFLDVCFKTATDDIDAPKITVHFEGADVVLDSSNVFLRVAEDVLCLAFVATESTAIYGNVAQANFLVGYDTQNMAVSFKPAKCTAI